MKNILYCLTYSIIISISLGALVIYKPVTYIDNGKSSIVCTKNNQKFEMGPNFIYIFGDKIDDFNDSKARKLCEYGLVKDYGNTLQKPSNVNYTLDIVMTQDSSWTNAIIAAFVLFIFGMIVIEAFFFLITKSLGKVGKEFLNIFEKLIY